MANTDYSLVAGYKDFVERISDEIFTKLYYGFDTAKLVTLHEGIKGKKVWTEQQLLALIKAYFSAFTPSDTNKLVPVTLETYELKVEHKEVPQDMESTYLGFLRRNGFNHQEWPLERMTITNLLTKIQQELEDAVWQAERKATAIAAGDSILVMFNGFLKIIADAIVAGDVTPVVTGAITEANILPNLKLMYAELSPELKRKGIQIRMSYANVDKYVAAMDAAHPNSDTAYVELGNAGYQGIRYRQGGGNTVIVPVTGMGDSDRIIFHPNEHYHIGFDSMADFSNFNFEQQVRELLYWLDFKLGVQMTLLRDGVTVVNDQA